MEPPTEKKLAVYDLSSTKTGIIELTPSGLYRVYTAPKIDLAPGENYKIPVNSSNGIDFAVFEEARSHLFELTEYNYQEIFHDINP